jgi:hypothetical protein
VKTILSLFDYTGSWSAPFADAGHNVIQLDIKHDPEFADVRRFSCHHLLEVMGIDWVDAIIAAPPCDSFTKSGAQYWPEKDRDGRTKASAHLVRQVLRCVDLYKPDWWVMENPAGRLSSVVPEAGKRVMYFHPCDFALWTNPSPADIAALDALRAKPHDQITPEDIQLVRRTNAYKKETGLWGSFTPPAVRGIEPVRVCSQGSWLQKLGGKTAKTKEERSVTPEGFAAAFYAANEWTPAREAAFLAKREADENFIYEISPNEAHAA